MPTFSFTAATMETLTGAGGAADIFELNAASDLTAGEAISDVNGGGYSDYFKIYASGTVNLSTLSAVGVDIVELHNAGPITLTIPNAFALNNYGGGGMTTVLAPSYGPGAINLDASGVAGRSLSLSLGNSADTAVGGAMADQLNGFSGADSLVGAHGADTLQGGSGADTLWGGGDVDSADGMAGVDYFYFEPGDISSGDEINGGGDDDYIRLSDAGGTYDLTLMTIAGVETLLGGPGADRVTIDYTQITPSTSLAALDLGGGVDKVTITGLPDGPYNLSSFLPALVNVEIIEMEVSGSPTITMKSGVDQVFISGVPSTDCVVGGGGADSIFSGDNADTLLGGGGLDLLVGGMDDDDLLGGSGADTLFGGLGLDIIDGETGADLVLGGMDEDFIDADEGADTLFGGDGDDDISVSPTNLFGVLAVGDIAGEYGDDSLQGGGGSDTLFGGDGVDSLAGGGAGDYLIGGAGIDTISGGVGAGDVMWGESGADVFLFASGHGADLIADFQPGVDVIRLESFAFSTFSAMESAITRVDYSNGVAITFANGDQLSIVGMAPGGLSASSFLII